MAFIKDDKRAFILTIAKPFEDLCKTRAVREVSDKRKKGELKNF
jgi:hypothetical protein